MGFYHTIPPEKSGQMYKSAYRKAIQDALLGASSLVSSFSSSSDNSKEKNVFMVPTAVLWEACKRLQSEMPKNNADAAARAWKTMLSLLKDAQAELKGICEEDEMAKQCQPVVDLAVFVFIKIEKRCLPEKQDNVAWYDRVCQAAQAVVDETDVLVSQLYEEEPDVIHKSMAQYNRRIWTLVEIAQEVAQGEHAKWFEASLSKWTQAPFPVLTISHIDVRQEIKRSVAEGTIIILYNILAFVI